MKRFAFIFNLLLGFFLLAGGAQAATLTVTSTSDALNPGGACTLRGAVAAINSAADANGCIATGAYGASDTIVFDDTAMAGQAVLFTSEIQITQPLILQGPVSAVSNPANRVTLQGGGSSSDFRLLNVTSATALTVQDIKFTEAHVLITLLGGAILSNAGGTVTVTRCAFANNLAFESGGALYAPGAAFVSDSTFSDNISTNGGAIAAGTVTVRTSTFSNNFALDYGGAIAAGTLNASASTFVGNSTDNISPNNGGAIYVSNVLTARHLTLVDNISTSLVGGDAIYLGSSTATADISNSLIVGNSSSAHCSGVAGSAFTGGYNLGWRNSANDTTCGAANAIDASMTPRASIVAATLDDNGGPTQTLLLPAGSPAIGQSDIGGGSQMLDAAFTWVDATLDQRGFPRKAAGVARNLGAFEYNPLTLSGTLPSGKVGIGYGGGTVIASNGTAPYTYAVTNGSLPPGLTLNATTGVVSGTPTQAGSYVFDVTATDSSGTPLLATESFSIFISAVYVPVPALGWWGLLALIGLVPLLVARRQR